MKKSNNSFTSLHTILKELIEAKSKRDNMKFTSYQLAAAVGIPRSILTKLTHPDENKRIINPKIETLLKIVSYFKSDGFDITIDAFLGLRNKSIDVPSLSLHSNKEIQKLPLFSLDNDRQQLGNIDIKLPSTNDHVQAYYLENDIPPFFKTGSIFIVNLSLNPANDTLVAIKLNGSHKIHIKKYHHKKNKTLLKSLTNEEKDILLMPTDIYHLLGVVTHINAKT